MSIFESREILIAAACVNEINLRSCMRYRAVCGAFARSTGESCKALALTNGRCKNHGGLSTGPKTKEGKLAIAQATRIRLAAGQSKKALEGFYRWLDERGRRTQLRQRGLLSSIPNT
jgi:hypothetical protein